MGGFRSIEEMSALPASEPVSIARIETLYRERYQRFLGFAIGMLGDRELAHDAVQETFARAIVMRAQLHGEQTLPNWLWRVLTNVCLASRNSKVRWRLNEPGPVSEEAGQIADGGIEWSELRSALMALPERQRLMVFLRHYADLDYNAIAEVEQGG